MANNHQIWSRSYRYYRRRKHNVEPQPELGLMVEKSILKRSIRAQDEGALSTRLGRRGAASSLSQALRRLAGCCCLEPLPSIPNSDLTVSAGLFGYCLLYLVPVSKARPAVQTSIRTTSLSPNCSLTTHMRRMFWRAMHPIGVTSALLFGSNIAVSPLHQPQPHRCACQRGGT